MVLMSEEGDRAALYAATALVSKGNSCGSGRGEGVSGKAVVWHTWVSLL